MKRSLSLTFFVFFCCLSSSIVAQVTIAPTNLFIDSNSRFGTYMVINNSDQNQEISIEFFYGYGQTDESGNRRTVTDDSAGVSDYSIAQHVNAFPRNFVLNPGQRQIVRLRINAPNDIPDGTYWARIKTAATPESPPVELSSTDQVSARVGITIEQVTGLFYKKGNVTTGIEIEEIRSELNDNEELVLLTDYKRTGNSPFLGSITYTLSNSNGNKVKEDYTSTSIYFDGTHRKVFDVSDLPSGEYKAQVQFETRRSDISQDEIVQMETVTKSATIHIP